MLACRRPLEEMTRLAATARRVESALGAEGRVLIRWSGTEPKLKLYVEGRDQDATLYDRSKLKSGNLIPGPAIVLEMDSTTLILPGHVGRVDDWGNILINPAA